jgi:hypothetical protein
MQRITKLKQSGIQTLHKIILVMNLIIAIFMIQCEGENTSPIVEFHNPLANPQDGPPAGNPDGNYPVPGGAGPENVSAPDHVIGNGTPESCTCNDFIDAVAQGGKIVFNCGPDPVTIILDRTAKVFNDANPDIVIDGNGLITLSGGGKTRILYMNTCDQNQHWTTSHCQNQEYPRLTVQNITFADGNATSETEYDGGGAIWIRGGQFKIVNRTLEVLQFACLVNITICLYQL